MGFTNTDKNYGKRLAELRKCRFIKQTMMAEILGLQSQQQYSNLENGKKHFTPDLLIKISEFFSVPIFSLTETKLQCNYLNKSLPLEDYQIIERAGSMEEKFLVYKKLFLESKMENVENKMKLLKGKRDNWNYSGAHHIYVFI